MDNLNVAVNGTVDNFQVPEYDADFVPVREPIRARGAGVQPWDGRNTPAVMSECPPLPELNKIVEIVRTNGLLYLEEAVQLASGEWSHDFVDGKRALGHGDDLGLACRAILDVVEAMGVEFDAIGGLTMGADEFAHVAAYIAHRDWFVIRKAVKGRGTNKRIEGGDIGPETRVVLVDDVVTTGGSIVQAYEVIRSRGASVVAAVTLVDRGDTATRYFANEQIPYRALVTYRDLGIEPIGDRRILA